MTTIHKKAYPILFGEVLSGRKSFDLRVADFVCQPGDTLVLDEVSEGSKKPTGRSITKKVGYVLKTKDLDFFDPDDVQEHGYQVISLLPEASSSLEALSQRAQEVRQKYNVLNAKDGHGKWGGKEYAMGLVGDVGELLEVIMAKENLRRGEDVDTKLAHELADCMWSVLVIANHYGVDLEKEFLKTMDSLEQRIAAA